MREIDSVCNSNFSNNTVFLKRELDANVEKGSLKCEWIWRFLSVPSNNVIPNHASRRDGSYSPEREREIVSMRVRSSALVTKLVKF